MFERPVWTGTALILMVLAILMGVRGYQLYTGADYLPQPVRVERPFFPQAEVLPAAQIHPGTFRVELPSVVEFQRIVATARPLVGFSIKALETLAVEYWLPRPDGSGVFYHTSEELSLPWCTWFLCSFNTELAYRDGAIVATPVWKPGIAFATCGLAVILTIFGAAALVTARTPRGS